MSAGSWDQIVTGLLEEGPDAASRIENRAGDFSIATVSSSSGDWRFVSAVGRAAHQAQVTEMRNTLMIFALGLAVAGVVVSFWFSWSTYSPIRMLQEFVAGRPAETEGRGSRPSVTSRYSEIEAILAGLNDAYRARDRLASAIERQRPLARAQLLTRLLQGIDEDVFLSLGPSAGFSFPYSHYFVFLIGLTARTNRSAWEREAVIQSLGELRGDGYFACGVEVHHREAIAVIANVAPTRSDRSAQRRIVSAAVSRLGEHHPSTPMVAIGLLHPGVRGITNSYVEAMAASEYTAGEGLPIQFFADITGPAARLPRLPLQLRLRLLQAVKEGQVDIAMDTLDDIVRSVAEVVESDQARAMYYRDLGTALREVAGKLGLDDQVAREPEPGDTREQLAALIRSLCRLVVIDRSSSADRLASHAVEFVERNYADAGLSLVLVADRFGTSLSHLSRVFKEQTGKTFSEYISDLRVERMMIMLRSTDLTVREIVLKVGYQDVPNCIRKFRQVVGVTPGKYRRGAALKTRSQ
ncbi:MAG: AraC family transcriptional regulator [Spirochaetaceae bacterium]|nr:MAG: AraC family transcriptional regulator [Spirochaetaceae bacterium]